MNKKHRLCFALSLLMALCLVLSIPMTALAAGSDSCSADAQAAVAEAKDKCALAQTGVDIIVDVIKNNDMAKDYFKGSATSDLVESAAKGMILDELEGEEREQLMRDLGFEPTEANKELVADELYDVACIYYDEEHRDGGTVESANKLACVELVRFVLVETKDYNNDDAQATAELYWELYQISNTQGDEAAVAKAMETMAKPHVDADPKDHKCDSCSNVLSECADTDEDKKCDICGNAICEHTDTDKDHNCDVCNKVMSECADASGDDDHDCDYCGKKDVSNCNDADKDFVCDECGKSLCETCVDKDPVDHICDVCRCVLGACENANKDHDCDYCGKELTKCDEGEKKDHKCDVCTAVLSKCADEDKDGKCDLCGKATECTTDNNHKYGAPVWTWAEDYSTASAVFTCSACKHTATEKATLAVEASAAPNCYVDGYKKYIAKVTLNGTEYTDRKQQTLPAAHNYVDGICTVCKDDINDYNVYRIYGDNRYQTAFGVADALKEQMGVEKFDAIIVASGSKFADALAGSYLAAVKNAPILVTNENNKQLVKVYIAQNLAEGGTLYILGGPNAVNANFDSSMTDYFTVKRLEGADRYETNLKILQEAGLKSGDEILVCTGKKFADSLSASAVGKPILLVKDSLYDTQKAYLEALGKNFKFTIIGGESAVSAELEAQLKAYGTTERIGGANRYETSTLVAERYFKEPETVVVAYGRKFPDGLCGGPLAYYLNAPLLLTQAGSEAAADAYTDKYGIITGYVLGGEAVIEDQTIKTIFEIKDEEDRLVEKKTAFSMEDSFTGSMGDIDPGLLEDLIGTLFPGANIS